MRARERARGLCDLPVRHGDGKLRIAVLARRLTRQLEEDVVERRSRWAYAAAADPSATQLGGRFLDQHEALPRRRQGQPVRPLIFFRRGAADAKEPAPGVVPLLYVVQPHLEDLAADAGFQLVAGAFRDHTAVVDNGDLVR